MNDTEENGGKIQVFPVGDGRYLVPSSSQVGVVYQVWSEGTSMRCTCPAGSRGRSCKHVRAVLEEKGEVPVAEKKNGVTMTKHGYPLDEVTSSFHKEVRLGREEEALFWGMELYEAAPYYFWKRILIQAAEDVGLADPNVMVQMNALAQAWDFCKRYSRFYVDPEHVVMAILIMCRALKSSDVDDAKCLIETRVKNGWTLEVPDYALDPHTKRGREMGRKGWGTFYRFRQRYLKEESPYFQKLKAEFPEFVGDLDD